jgi:hypothetical protein
MSLSKVFGSGEGLPTGGSDHGIVVLVGLARELVANVGE